MKLKNLAEVRAGYLNRAKIRPTETGSFRLLQARDVNVGVFDCGVGELVRFDPDVSSRDISLKDDDVVFMARGAKNYAALLTRVPDSTLAAASFFVLRASSDRVDPCYLTWFLNQSRVQSYFTRNSGRGVRMPVVRRTVLEHLEIPIPSIAAQKKIAELFRLSLEEQELTGALFEKRTRLMEAVCLRAAERGKS